MSIVSTDSGIIELSQNQLNGLMSSQEDNTDHNEEFAPKQGIFQVHDKEETNKNQNTSKLISTEAPHVTSSAIEVLKENMNGPEEANHDKVEEVEDDSWIQPEFSMNDELSLEIGAKNEEEQQPQIEDTVHQKKPESNLQMNALANKDESPAEIEDEYLEDVQQSEDNEDGDELLDQLCDNLEADEYHQKKEEFVQAKNKQLDDKLKKIQQQKQIKQEALQEKIISKAMDQRSGLILRKDSRVATEDEISAKAGRRKFLKIEKFDSKEGRDFLQAHGQSQGAYTIGVVVDKSPLRTTSSNNKFVIVKLSDLEKYNLNQVKAHLEKTVDKAELPALMKSFTKNGYKQISVMCFGDAAETIAQYHCGTIWAVLNPRLMKQSSDDGKYGLTFTIDNEAQLQMIGYSEHFSLCQGKSSQNSVTQGNQFVNKTFACREFVNKSCETLCDQHKIEKKMANFEKFRAGRMNTMGERVDINHINRMRKLEDKEKKMMGFVQTDKSVLNRQSNKPMPIISQEEKDKREALWKKEQSKIGTYFNYRDRKFQLSHGMNDLMRTGLKCQENKFANKNSAAALEKSSNKMDMQRSKVMAPKPPQFAQNVEENGDDDDGFEIDFGGNKQEQQFSFKKQLLQKFMQKPQPLATTAAATTGIKETTLTSGQNLSFANGNGKKATLQQMMERTKSTDRMEKQQKIIDNSSTLVRDRLGIRKLKK